MDRVKVQVLHTALRAPTQTVSQWREDILKKFITSIISLQNYGGDHIDVLAQVDVTLSQENQHVDAMVFVQKDAPKELLLGTDAQPNFGFSLIITGGDGKVVDLLVRHSHRVQGATVTSSQQTELELPSPTYIPPRARTSTGPDV